MSQCNGKSESGSVMTAPLQEHIERLYTSRKATEEILQNRRKEINQLVDPVTGQEFFKPKIGRPPREKSEIFSVQREKSVSYVQRLELAGKERNEELLVRKKRTRYLEIFQAMNPCNVEKIYFDVLTTQFLDPEVVKVIYPLLQEMEETGEKLDFEEFFDSVENLCKYLTPEERYVLIKEKPKPEVKFEVKPRLSSSTGRMYSRSVKFKEDADSKLNAERIKKSDNELKECTFHPKITQYKRSKQSHNYSWLLSN